jgi:DNA-binding transcriptional MocR family regulator
MTIWLPDLSSRSGPRYQAIAAAIVDAIDKGDLPPGSRLPPQRDLAWKLGVTVGTVSRAYMLAEQRGLLSGEVGRGTYVRDRGTAAGAQLLGRWNDGAMDLSRNVPHSDVHDAALRSALHTLADRQGIERLLHYMPSAGHPEHRAAGAAWIGRTGLRVTPEQVLLTGGAQQAMAAIVGTLLNPGEVALTEALTYCGLMDVARLHRARLEGVAMDDEGMLPDALERAVRSSGAKLVILTPTVHNPTTAIMGTERRHAIVEVARRHDLTIVEDDVYGFLPLDRPAPIAALAPERTIYVASASKCIAPGLRVGWIACPPALVEPLTDAIHAMSIALPAMTAEVVRMWINDGTAARLTETLRRETAARQELMAEIFTGFTMRRHPASFHVLLHLPEPWVAEEFALAARERGLIVIAAPTFAVTRGAAPSAVRISLSAAANEEILGRALSDLRNLLNSGPRHRRAII